jgi:hypothetical protein
LQLAKAAADVLMAQQDATLELETYLLAHGMRKRKVKASRAAKPLQDATAAAVNAGEGEGEEGEEGAHEDLAVCGAAGSPSVCGGGEGTPGAEGWCC